MPSNSIDKIKKFDKFGSVLGLTRMEKLMQLLGNPQDKLKYIHVAGTNGKGSVCRYIYSALLANGYSVGLFTSPFLEVFNERIEMNGELINDEDLAICTDQVIQKTEEMVNAGEDSPTEFEVVTAIAFLYFAMKKAEFVVLEVGLGGSGDSTNIIKTSEISIITSISFDHMDRLGDTLFLIASEKAGIIKKGVPVVMNVDEREAQVPIAKKAYEKKSILYNVKKIPYAVSEKSVEKYVIDTNIYGTDYSGVEISMIGRYQVDNIMTALTALEILRKDKKIQIERTKLYEGLFKASHKGRFERIGDKIVLDGAHNEAGAKALVDTLKELYGGKKILALVGILRDKEYEKILEELSEVVAKFIFTEIDNPRKCEAEELVAKANSVCCNNVDIVIDAHKNSKDALESALEESKDFDLLLVSGSLYLIGELRPIILERLKL
ncbi:MAG: bifunctional folylpolyglutamate synthase/dihydrofolate synthase [Eubacteriales bacterium]